MEAALSADDPRLVSTLNGRARSPKAGRALTGFVGILGGMAVLLAGLIAQVIAVGIVGFLISLAGLVVLLSNLSLGRSEFKDQKGARNKWSTRLDQANNKRIIIPFI